MHHVMPCWPSISTITGKNNLDIFRKLFRPDLVRRDHGADGRDREQFHVGQEADHRDQKVAAGQRDVAEPGGVRRLQVPQRDVLHGRPLPGR